MKVAQFHEYTQAKYGDVLDSVVNTDNTVPGIILRFKANVTQSTRDAVAAEISTYQFSQPDPNFKQFLIDVFNDGAIPAAARRDVSQMGLWFKLGEKQVALALWQLLSGGASAAAIRQHALDNNVVLP